MHTPLTAEQTAGLQADLAQHRERLRGQLKEHLHGQSRAERASETLAQDADDAPQRGPEREVALALTAREQREVDAIDAALARLHDGRYGVCADCGVDIPYARLQAEPWALRCVVCESRHETRRPA